MPCDSSHMNPNRREKEVSKIVQLLDELDGLGPPDPNIYGNGYDKRVYNCCTKELADSLISTLCSRLKQLGDVSGYSLELQMWWRDHQAIDRAKEVLSKGQE